jgi:putative flippase GtrA
MPSVLASAYAVLPARRRARSHLDNLNRMHDAPPAVEIRGASIPRPVDLRPHMRLLHGMRRPENWVQLVQFGVVGAIGFVVNIAVYALFVHGVGIDYHVAAAVAWLVAVLNNFILNRHWTFDASGGRAHHQAARFLIVSLCAFAVSQLLLTLFVEVAALPKVPAQALAVATSMPLNFIGNKLWTFRSAAAERLATAER